MRTLELNLAERSYNIYIDEGLLNSRDLLSKYCRGEKVLILSNETIAPIYIDQLSSTIEHKNIHHLVLPDGEIYKNLDSYSHVLDFLVENQFRRNDTLVTLGGGVIGDLGGFVAASYQRGMDFIQVPTSLLAQVDSSVGGKTGVNHPGGKNLIGAFHQPQCVLIDTDTLETLPDRELAAGLAEVIKYGAIVDADFFDWLERNIDSLAARNPEALASAIARSCELKAEVVSADEREAGRRAILNFGHTFGHAIERCQGYGDWLHGEAVAAGMLMAARLSGIPEKDIERIRSLNERAGLPTEPPPIAAADMMAAMGLDKKVLGNRIRFVVLDELGSARVTSDYDEALLERILESGK